MQTRRLWFSLIGIVVLSVALLGNELRQGHEPALGLDLQGGVSVILEPTTDVSGAELDTLADIVRDAVDGLGIAEPDVRVEGSTIAVDLPGVKDQERAIELTQVTGKVSLHPVIQCSSAPLADTTTPAPASTTPVTGGGPTTAPRPSTTTTAPGGSTTTPGTGGATTTPGTSTGGTIPAETTALPSGFRRSAPATTAAATTPTTPAAPATTAATTTSATTTPGATIPGSTTPGSTTPGSTTPGSTPGGTDKDYPVELPGGQLLVANRPTGECIVGPSGGSGEVFSRNSASAVIVNGAWSVEAGISDSSTWNGLAAQCYQAVPQVCPRSPFSPEGRGALAIVLDGEVQSAPAVNAPSFEDTVSITGSFTEREARDLAGVLNRGAYPFEVQPATVFTVSPSLGSDSLRATIIAGLIGVGLVMLLMFFYYRSMALVILSGLVLAGVIMYGLLTFLSEQRNLALTLAGAAGIIVSIGVTVDSYVVLFERLKDEVRHGRTLRNSALRGFNNAWRTIVNADVTALIGALVLFWLSVGSVRGFAFFLAMSTIVDLLVLWFFTRPMVLLLAKSNRYGRHVMGIDTSKVDVVVSDRLAGESR